MPEIAPDLLQEIRNRFAHIDVCPFEGPRVFFENAGGALTLKSVVDTSAKFAAIPDNQGRDNPASKELMRIIGRAKSDMAAFFNAPDGQFFVGESGTEILFRLLRAAIMGSAAKGNVVGSTLEHPASSSAAKRWAEIAGHSYTSVTHNDETGSVSPEDYAPHVNQDTRVATILHTSPVTGMSVDVAAIARVIRAASPNCFIVVDGIQHAAHGGLDIKGYDIDGYAVSPYKVFSRHGYGIGWLSGRLAKLPHDALKGGPAENWELGTRDTGAYATFSDVIDYFEWLGAQVSGDVDRQTRFQAAGQAIATQEKSLTDAMLFGTGNLKGLADMQGVGIIGGLDNPRREGLVSMTLEGMDAPTLVSKLRDHQIRVHARKDDHYSGGVLRPLGLTGCVRVSMCHYNTLAEVAQFLTAMQAIVAEAG